MIILAGFAPKALADVSMQIGNEPPLVLESPPTQEPAQPDIGNIVIEPVVPVPWYGGDRPRPKPPHPEPGPGPRPGPKPAPSPVRVHIRVLPAEARIPPRRLLRPAHTPRRLPAVRPRRPFLLPGVGIPAPHTEAAVFRLAADSRHTLGDFMIIIYTGNGKGKTSACVGQAIRLTAGGLKWASGSL